MDTYNIINMAMLETLQNELDATIISLETRKAHFLEITRTAIQEGDVLDAAFYSAEVSITDFLQAFSHLGRGVIKTDAGETVLGGLHLMTSSVGLIRFPLSQTGCAVRERLSRSERIP